MNKEVNTYKYTHTHTCICIRKGIPLSQKKDEILPFTARLMDLEAIMLSEISQTEKDKHCMISLIYGVKKKYNNPVNVTTKTSSITDEES